MIRSVPKYLASCRIHIGCDANCKFAFSEDLSSHVGPPLSEVMETARRSCYLGFLLEFELAAATYILFSHDLEEAAGTF